MAREKYPDCQVIYFPLDFTWAVKQAMERVKPSLIVLVELELWPNFILEASARSIPLVLINGRMSERSFRGYRRIRWLKARLWRALPRSPFRPKSIADVWPNWGSGRATRGDGFDQV